MVNHKTITNKIRKTRTQVPKDEQYRHENYLPAIIDKQTYEQAQKLLENHKRKRNELKTTADLLEKMIEEQYINDAYVRLLVKTVYVHQNEDKSLDVRLEFNGDFDDIISAFQVHSYPFCRGHSLKLYFNTFIGWGQSSPHPHILFFKIIPVLGREILSEQLISNANLDCFAFRDGQTSRTR